jgi:transcriptional regulator with XRE-family HTH domain
MGNKSVLWQRFLEKLKIRARETLRIDPEKEWGIQRRIAKKLEISESVVQRWFAGAFPTAEYLLKIKEVFGLSIDEILSGETPGQVKSLPSLIELADLVSIVEAGMETEDFVSFPIQIFNSTIQAGSQFLGQVIIHKRVFGRRKNLAAVQLNGGKEIKVVIVGK